MYRHVAQVPHKTLNLIILRCCLAEDGREMYQNSKRTYRAFVFLIKSYCFVTFSLPSAVVPSETALKASSVLDSEFVAQ